MTGKIKKIFQGLVVLTLASLFFALGLWQLDRARDLSASEKKPVLQDQRIYPLNDLTSPEGSLPVAAFSKSVEIGGNYIATYMAPNQRDIDGKVADWEVALLQVDSAAAILVVRGLWQDRATSPDISTSENLTITGALQPTQFEDRAAGSPKVLSRLDSSLLTSAIGLQLYDGFVTASSEKSASQAIERERIRLDIPKGDIPGYYWQHISYVVVWWLMAALVLWAPFYKRRDER